MSSQIACPASEPLYRTPAGYVDWPFAYMFDGSGLTDATSPQNLAVRINYPGDFFLRRIAGLSTLAAQIQLFNASSSRAQSALMTVGDNYTVLPEKLYPFGSQIAFNLGTVLRANNACGLGAIYTSFLMFQGVRRQTATGTKKYCNYKPHSFRYNFALAVDWRHYDAGGGVLAPRRFVQQILNYDFELQAISVAFASGAAASTDFFQILLYDAGGTQLSSLPLNPRFLNLAGTRTFGSVFPVPSVIYPIGSFLQFDITSLICNTDGAFPKNYEITFHGMERVPCE
jgi:hypothetical protein